MNLHTIPRLLLLLGSLATAAAAAPQDDLARQILDATGVEGGIIVHLNCGDGKLTAALHASGSYLVQGLDADAGNVAAAREHVKSLDLYGPVSIDRLSGSNLPYIDDSINLVVAENLGNTPMQEVMRILAPRGTGYIKRGGRWTKTVKPWPPGRDEWTHYLHDPTNNAVAHDDVVAPPSRYQWMGSPRYSRHHDHMSSVSAVATSGGRIFYVLDEAPRALILIPPKWSLIARDAFNGTVLWKRSISRWHEHLWPLKSGPQILARRLVAAGDRVYATLAIDGPLTALDAATGRTLHTYEGTRATEEVLLSDGVFFLSVAAKGQPLRSDPARRYPTLQAIRSDVTNPLWTDAPRTILAVKADSGEVLWKKVSNLVSMSLAADKHGVFLHDGKGIVCLDRTTGDVRWTSKPLPRKLPMRSSGGVTLVLHDGVVLYDGQTPQEKPRGRARTTTMFALSADDGTLLWKAVHAPCGHMGTPVDLLVAGDLVWGGAVAIGSDSGIMTGRDLRTGEVKSQFPPDVQTHWFHHRCYRAKATDKYLLFSRTGIEFIDWEKQHWIPHHWVRGACHYGVLPANGLIYAPEHPCACYLEAKLFGFTALAPARKDAHPPSKDAAARRLERGPAFEDMKTASAEPADPARDWPTFRHDAARSGATKNAVAPRNLRCAWQASLGGRLSSPVAAQGKIFVASIDTHTVHALDAGSGQIAWSFTAGGRVDSPPTVWRGRVLFGSADGRVYCLRASDGQLAWRFRAAPEDLRMGACEQLESVWPVHGSVLVQDGVLYCVAGRSMFLDGGLRLLRLDPATGRKLSETVLDDRDPATDKNLQDRIQGLNMPVALPDVLSCDGKYVYMRSLPFTLEGRRKFVEYVPVRNQEGDDVHLFSPTGFLDGSMWHRTYWVYGRAWASGAGGYYQAGRRVPAGRLLVFDDSTVYGFGRYWQYYRWTTPLEFELFAAAKNAPMVTASTEKKPIRKKGVRIGVRTISVTRVAHEWSADTAVQVNALVLTPGVLFVAGPPDVEREEASVKALSDSGVQSKLEKQEEAFEGLRGGLLVAVSPKSGKKLGAYKLPAMPRFDGMIAAGGRLYVTTASGTVLCLGGGEGAALEKAPGVSVTPRPQQPTQPLEPRKQKRNRNRPRRDKV